MRQENLLRPHAINETLVLFLQAISYCALVIGLVKYSFVTLINMGVREGPHITSMGLSNPCYLCS